MNRDPVVGLEVYWIDRACRMKVTAVGIRTVYLVPLHPGERNGRVVLVPLEEFRQRSMCAGQLELPLGDFPDAL